jgi:hypothetical protein
VAAATFTTLAIPSPAPATQDPGCGEIAVVQRSDQVIYPLPRTFLRAGSDSVRSSARAYVRGTDYALEPTRGVLRLRVAPVPGETLWVRVCGLLDPPALETRFSSYRPIRAGTDSAAVDSAAPPAPRPGAAHSVTDAPSGTSLAIQGNKTIAVDFGSNQDAFLRQSLDLAVSGALAPGVEITGVLSDRNTPLTASGSTQDLQSVDRLLIEVRAPRGGAALGDVALSLDHGEFGRLDRRLQGVRGEWSAAGLTGVAAAASAEGEFHRLQFFGVEGRQGPYLLTGPSGELGIAVVPGSEAVTVDGERLVRGEGADYAMDYERAQITFTNRRPVGATSRVTVDYQVAVNRFRRNLAGGAIRWGQGPWRLAATALTEGDDRGRPLTGALDASDRLVLSSAGDSASLAVGAGVSLGGGDYDLVSDVAGSYFAFAGPDSGDYALTFTAVPAGQGDYLDSAVVAGRVIYRHVGAGLGAYRVGRKLPLADAHQLWDVSAGASLGALRVDLEGAVSNLDRNTFSTLDDGDNLGQAGSARLTLEGRAPGWLGGTAGIAAASRSVGQRFAPFSRLERPFAEEDWGLPPGADLERQTRHEGGAYVRPGIGGELRASVGRLETADGFESFRRTVAWERAGRLVTRARWERSDGEDRARTFADGGRERRGAELGLELGWLQPALRGDWDERWTPSDTGRAGARSREWAAEVRSGARVPWRLAGSFAVRRDAALEAEGYRDRSEVRSTRLGLQTAEGRRWSTSLAWQRRSQSPLAAPGRTVSDLASVRLAGASPERGWNAAVALEVTSEGESKRTRQLAAVGPGLGAYDSLGNFVGVGQGDYVLSVVAGAGLARVARAATSARLAWQPRTTGVWQGSRAELTVETEARRRGALRGTDAWLSTGALGDEELSRASITQRFEIELAPEARAGAVRARLERRASADRSFTNYSQTQDQMSGTARVRTRPGGGWTTEVEGRLERGTAEQTSGSLTADHRQRRAAVLARAGYAPHAGLRLAWVSDLDWAREEGLDEWSRTWRLGPELGWSLLARGRLEWSARRALTTGPEVGPLLPGADSRGAVRWESTTRFDYRLADQTTVGVALTSRDRDGRAPEHEGRAEARAFF